MTRTTLTDLTIRCLVGLSCSAGLGCADPPADPADSSDAADDVGTTGDSSESSESAGSTATTDTSATDSTDTTTDTTDGPPVDMGTPPDDPNENIPPLDEEGCPGIYAQDLLPTFELTITPEVWDQLVSGWLNGAAIQDMGLDFTPNLPLEQFKYNDIIIDDAMIRLRGNPDFWGPEDKMQFQVDFNEIDKSGRFLGLRALAFDAATFNRHMLRDRLALSIMRDMGIDAPCANSARLNINGEYHGLYTSLEKLDKTFLVRVFDDPSGDLWKRANWELKTNENTSNDERLEALKDASSIPELETYLDLEQALSVFAAEAIIPDSDGMWAGGLNFYLYDEPISGKFQLLPWDLDNTFERFNDPPGGDYPANPDPVVWEKPTTHGRPFYDLALTDPEWFDYYIASVAAQVESGYQPDVLHERIDTWSAQIHDSVFEDTYKPYTNNLYLTKVQELHAYVQARYEYLDVWLDCWEGGGMADAEGYCFLP